MSESLEIARIRRDGGTQPRAFIDPRAVEDYAEALAEGVTLPAVKVFYDGQNHWLADGFHRVDAAEGRGSTHIEADIEPGTREDAQWFSFGANKTHGLRRTTADKQRAVQAALNHPLAATKSTSEIAAHCGVSRDMVKSYREPIMAIRQDNGKRTVTRAGQTFTMETAKIGKKKKPKPAAPPNPQPAPETPETPAPSTVGFTPETKVPDWPEWPLLREHHERLGIRLTMQNAASAKAEVEIMLELLTKK